jgi:hypothetical protein
MIPLGTMSDAKLAAKNEQAVLSGAIFIIPATDVPCARKGICVQLRLARTSTIQLYSANRWELCAPIFCSAQVFINPERVEQNPKPASAFVLVPVSMSEDSG